MDLNNNAYYLREIEDCAPFESIVELLSASFDEDYKLLISWARTWDTIPRYLKI